MTTPTRFPARAPLGALLGAPLGARRLARLVAQRHHRLGALPGRQRGVVLIIALIMLMVVTMLSVSTLSVTAQQERMSGNVRDRNLAFQAAEAAVQWCLIKTKTDTAWVTANKQTPATPPTQELWKTHTWAGAPSVTVTMGTGSGLSADPRCLLEDLGNGSYVITGRAVGRSDKAVAMVQATFTP